jgi:hypothetical protein
MPLTVVRSDSAAALWQAFSSAFQERNRGCQGPDGTRHEWEGPKSLPVIANARMLPRP